MTTAVVLTGGRSTRMGCDKASTPVAGVPMLHRVLESVPVDWALVLVGPPPSGVTRPAVVCREQPPGGGPVSAVAAAMAHVRTKTVVLLATDMPLLGETPADLARALERAGPQVSAVLAVDGSGHPQPICAAYRSDVLRQRLRGLPDVRGASMRTLINGLPMRLASHPSDGHLVADVDTPEDLRAVEHWLHRMSVPSSRPPSARNRFPEGAHHAR